MDRTHWQARDRACAVTQGIDQGKRLPELFYRFDPVSTHPIRYPKQVERFSHPLGVFLFLKNAEGFVMGLQSFLNASGVHEPISEAIEAARPQDWGSLARSLVEGLTEPGSRLLIIVSGPQKAEGHHTLPLHTAIMSRAGGVA